MSLTLSFLLILLGLVLLVVEVFVPSGGLISVISIICIICGVTMVFYYSDDVHTGIMTLTAVLILLPITIGISFYFWPRTPIGKQMILMPPDAYEDELDLKPGLEHLLGQVGKTLTPLRPSGVTLIEGRRMDTKTEGLFVDAQQWVRVVDIQVGNQIVVRPLSSDEVQQLDNLTT